VGEGAREVKAVLGGFIFEDVVSHHEAALEGF
jgi:hypothetical protein